MRFAPKKDVTLHPRATDFQEKKAVFFGGGGKGAFRPKKGCNAPSAGYRFPRNFFLDDLLNYTTLMLKFCTNKQIWASLLRQVCFFGGEGGVLPQKRV